MEMELLTAKELAVRWQVYLGTIYRLVNKGELPGFRVGTSLRFSLADIEQYENRIFEVVRRPGVGGRKKAA